MSGKRKVSQAGIEWIVDIVTRRSDLERKLSMFPTNKVIADELGVSERWIVELVRKHVRVKIAPRGTENNADTSSRRNNPL